MSRVTNRLSKSHLHTTMSLSRPKDFAVLADLCPKSGIVSLDMNWEHLERVCAPDFNVTIFNQLISTNWLNSASQLTVLALKDHTEKEMDNPTFRNAIGKRLQELTSPEASLLFPYILSLKILDLYLFAKHKDRDGTLQARTTFEFKGKVCNPPRVVGPKL